MARDCCSSSKDSALCRLHAKTVCVYIAHESRPACDWAFCGSVTLLNTLRIRCPVAHCTLYPKFRPMHAQVQSAVLHRHCCHCMGRRLQTTILLTAQSAVSARVYGSDLRGNVAAKFGTPKIVCIGTVHTVCSSTAVTQLLHEPTQVTSFQMFRHHF